MAANLRIFKGHACVPPLLPLNCNAFYAYFALLISFYGSSRQDKWKNWKEDIVSLADTLTNCCVKWFGSHWKNCKSVFIYHIRQMSKIVHISSIINWQWFEMYASVCARQLQPAPHQSRTPSVNSVVSSRMWFTFLMQTERKYVLMSVHEVVWTSAFNSW